MSLTDSEFVYCFVFNVEQGSAVTPEGLTSVSSAPNADASSVQTEPDQDLSDTTATSLPISAEMSPDTDHTESLPEDQKEHPSEEEDATSHNPKLTRDEAGESLG